MRFYLLILLLVSFQHVVKAADTQDLIMSSTNEEQCLKIAGDNVDLIDQCMDQAY